MSNTQVTLLPAPSVLEEIEAEAVRLARGAGAILLQHFRQPLSVRYKSGDRSSPVTEVDQAAEAYLREAIARAFPDHGIVGEEEANSSHKTPDFVWVLDPLDGTTNFLNGFPIFACSIGVLHRGRPVAAALFIPAIGGDGGSVYHARAGGGTRLDGELLTVATNPEPQRGSLTMLPAFYWRLYGFRDGLRRRLGEIRSSGSIAYDLAMTARGTVQFCMFNAPKIWDVAGGVMLVIEAGGQVLVRHPRSRQWSQLHTFVSDSPSLDNLHEWRGGIIAGNPQIVQHISDRIWMRSFRLRLLRNWLAGKMTARRERKAGGQEKAPEQSAPGDASRQTKP